jgi:hypothetical protein
MPMTAVNTISSTTRGLVSSRYCLAIEDIAGTMKDRALRCKNRNRDVLRITDRAALRRRFSSRRPAFA